MYTGEMIDNLIEKVLNAEQCAQVSVVQARKPATVAYNTFIYEFSQQRRDSAEVA